MHITIHRGLDQIGGSIVEISTSTSRVFVDMGDNLPGNGPALSDDARQALVDAMFAQNKRQHQGLFYTHSHPDHTGMLPLVPGRDIVKQYASLATRDLLRLRNEVLLERAKEAEDEDSQKKCMHMLKCIDNIATWPMTKPRRRPANIVVGDIKVTPFFVSHSTYGSHALLIEADGKSIFHTGDYRSHGYLGKSLEKMIEYYVGQVDVLITEGTMLTRKDADTHCETEAALADRMTEVMARYPYVFVLTSSSDLERLMTVATAARRTRHQLCADSLIFYRSLDYFRRQTPFFNNLYRRIGLLPEPGVIADMQRNGFALLFGAGHASRVADLRRQFPPEKTVLIYSCWDGYYLLDEQREASPEYARIRSMFSNVVDLHTAGHADAPTIASMIKTTNPREGIIGIHKAPGASLTWLELPPVLKSRIIPDNAEPLWFSRGICGG